MSLVKTLNQPVTPGTALIAVVAQTTTFFGGTVSSITQVGATWNFVVSRQIDSVLVEIWVSMDAFGASETINITTGTNLNEEAMIAEYFGVHEISGTPVDQTASDAGTGQIADSGTTPTTLDPVELWIAAFGIRGTGVTVTAPTGGFSIEETETVGTGSTTVTIALLDQVVASFGTANATVDTGTVSSPWAGVVATFLGTAPASVLPVTAVDPVDYGDDGGYLVRVLGDFTGELGNAFKVHIGLNADATDPECVSGIPGQGTDIFPLNATEMRCYTPRLDVGLQHVFVRRKDNTRSGILANALEIFPRGFETSVYDMRRVMPPFYFVGPRTIEEES